MNYPLVSVVMSVYNGSEYIRQTIDSILAQTYRNIEFLIINNGSTDSSEEIILSYPDKRIKYIQNKKSKGLIASLNLGISLSQGEYIARIDSDNIADPERLDRQLEFLMTHPDHGMCGTFYRIIDSKGEVMEQVELPSSHIEAKTFLMFGNCFCHSSIMIKASLIRELKYRKEYQVCEDYDLWHRASQLTKVSNIPIYATMYRVHGQSISQQEKKTQDNQVGLINKNFLEDHRIPYTPEELEIHTNFLRFNHGYYETNGFAKLEDWLIKLGRKLSKDPEIHQPLAHKVIIRRWITICVHARRIDCLFLNKLLLRYGFFYVECFYEKVMDKIRHRNPGYDL